MYHVLLSNRYLRSRLIPLVAVAAVALCVALVIIVVSVMSGFLDQVRDSGRVLMGDVVISNPVHGIAHYDRLMARLDARPEVRASTPLVDGWGLLKMPYPFGPRKMTETVQFWAIDPATFPLVTGYADTLHWRPLSDEEMRTTPDSDYRRDLMERLGADQLDRIRTAGLSLEGVDRSGRSITGICMGLHVSEGNIRTEDGTYRPANGGYWWMPSWDGLVLTTLPNDTAASDPRPESVALAVVNEFQSGVYLIDDKRVFIPIDVGQRLLHLDESAIVDDEGEETGFVEPARATMVLIRAEDGISPDELAFVVDEVYKAFRTELFADETVHPSTVPPPETENGRRVQTWRQQQAAFIDPIEKERELMRTIFSLIYLVCAGLVLAIFWSIVQEKTRDIGILRSLGASRFGIAMIFVRYGLVIGVLGGLVGVFLAWLVVSNINGIHDLLGDPPMLLGVFLAVGALISAIVTALRARSGYLLPVAFGSLITLVFAVFATAIILGSYFGGVVIWDPSVYYFDEIPSRLDIVTAVSTVIFAVIFSVIGAFFPAARAADTDPVQALRYE